MVLYSCQNQFHKYYILQKVGKNKVHPKELGIVVQRDKSSCCDCEHSQNQHTIYEHDEDSWVKAQQKHSMLNTESTTL